MKYLFLIDLDFLRPDSWFGDQILERTPAALSMLFLIGLGIVIGSLLLFTLAKNRKHKFTFESTLPKEVTQLASNARAGRSLSVWSLLFMLLAVSVLGTQFYWVYFADESNEQFQALAYKDLRNRRIMAANLRGWMFDRTGKLPNALAYYKADRNGRISRSYALDKEMAHLLGTERGTPGLERTLYLREPDSTPEAWDVLTKIKTRETEQRDVKVTLHRDLQAYVAKQLEGKKGAVVVINPQNGDILAMYSNPSFELSSAQSLDGYLKLEADKQNKPLLNRATREYYVSGSVFKTFTMIAAFRAGKQNARFSSFADGFKPFRGSRPIVDSTQTLQSNGSVTGACGGGCQEKDLESAYKVSSNQYFAQLAIELGRERIRETAIQLGIAPVERPQDALIARLYPELWNTSNRTIANSIAPQQSTIVTGKDISAYDIGLEGIGQGYSGQMTPLQIALITAAAGNMEGKMMKPRIELDQPPEAFSQVLTPEQAARVRRIMSTVTEEPSGTGTVISSKLAGTGIRTGGKTGTAEKLAPLFDDRGVQRTETRRRKNDAGEFEEYTVPLMYERTDSWFISIAPIELPQVAISVVVEGGGFGSRTAAPIAANIILKARELGLLGPKYQGSAKTSAKP